MRIKISEFIRQIIGIWDNIKSLFTEFLLEFDHINTKSIFPSQFETVRKVVDLLVLIEIVIYVLFVRLTRP